MSFLICKKVNIRTDYSKNLKITNSDSDARRFEEYLTAASCGSPLSVSLSCPLHQVLFYCCDKTQGARQLIEERVYLDTVPEVESPRLWSKGLKQEARGSHLEP